MADVMYRKTRDEIADQFPRLVSTVIPFELSPPEKAIYHSAAVYTLSRLAEATEQFGSGFSLEHHYGDAEDGVEMKLRGDIMAGLLMLRLTADDPNLIIDSAERFADEDDHTGSALAHIIRGAGVLDNVPEVSTKRKLFAETLAADVRGGSQQQGRCVLHVQGDDPPGAWPTSPPPRSTACSSPGT